jgi:type 1 fimbria pilin
MGTTTGTWIDVPVALNNCPSFFGSKLTANDGVGTGVTSPLQPNTISFNVVPVTSIVDATQSVMALQPDGVNPTASGIGIQLVKANNTSVFLSNRIPSDLILNETNGSNYTIPLKARYYQTAPTTSAGQANGAATITLIYN